MQIQRHPDFHPISTGYVPRGNSPQGYQNRENLHRWELPWGYVRSLQDSAYASADLSTAQREKFAAIFAALENVGIEMSFETDNYPDFPL